MLTQIIFLPNNLVVQGDIYGKFATRYMGPIDFDLEGTALEMDGVANVVANSASNGSVVRNANGIYTYTPNDGFLGTDSFSYTVTSSSGHTHTSTIEILVEDNCGNPSLGYEDYRGSIATTEGGYTCQSWDSQSPHTHGYTPDKYSELEGNYCRNPDGECFYWYQIDYVYHPRSH